MLYSISVDRVVFICVFDSEGKVRVVVEFVCVLFLFTLTMVTRIALPRPLEEVIRPAFSSRFKPSVRVRGGILIVVCAKDRVMVRTPGPCLSLHGDLSLYPFLWKMSNPTLIAEGGSLQSSTTHEIGISLIKGSSTQPGGFGSIVFVSIGDH